MFICKVALTAVKSKYQSTLKKIGELQGLTVSNIQTRLDLYVKISRAMQHSHTAQPHSTATQHGHAARPRSTATQHSHTAQPHSTATQHGHTAQPCSTTTQHSHTAWPRIDRKILFLSLMNDKNENVYQRVILKIVSLI